MRDPLGTGGLKGASANDCGGRGGDGLRTCVGRVPSPPSPSLCPAAPPASCPLKPPARPSRPAQSLPVRSPRHRQGPGGARPVAAL